MAKKKSSNLLLTMHLNVMAFNFNFRKSLGKLLEDKTGWNNFAVGLQTEDKSVESALLFRGGKLKVSHNIPRSAEVTLIFADLAALQEILHSPPMDIIKKNKARAVGNVAYLSLFNYLVARFLGKTGEVIQRLKKSSLSRRGQADPALRKEMTRRKKNRLAADNEDPGVKHLEDPYLSQYSIEDFPRLQELLEVQANTPPEICVERAKLLTDWFKYNGFETDSKDRPWVPELRQAYAFKDLLEQRQAIIAKNDLLAGTTTNNGVGVLLYPDALGTAIWGELNLLANRQPDPYHISQENIDILHLQVLPYWAKRNFREMVRKNHGHPLSQKIDERFAAFFAWKQLGISHTVPDYARLLRLGTAGILQEIDDEFSKEDDIPRLKRISLKAMVLSLQGVTAYAQKLSQVAAALAQKEPDIRRKRELGRLAEICQRVPQHPAQTLDEAVNAIWILHHCLHLESTGVGLSLGRLDQLLQPYWEADLEQAHKEELHPMIIERAIELVGCLFLRCNDHLPLVPSIENPLLSGMASSQAVTLGGVTSSGEDAVNDMTYVILKVTELLGLREPNVNARYHEKKNSDTYLTRICEVNLLTGSTPAIHNDRAVVPSLATCGYALDARRDWSVAGGGSPCITGHHMGHGAAIILNLAAPLEMALNNGRHPHMKWDVGPQTGGTKDNAFETFEDFLSAFESQLKFLVGNATKYNHLLGEAHALIRPSPLLSTLIKGCINRGWDVTRGGATYNTSGLVCVGLADVADSLMALQQVVFGGESLSYDELQRALRSNFKSHATLSYMMRRQVRQFGSNAGAATTEMANKVMQMVSESLQEQHSFRGGAYTLGFCSHSSNVAFGSLTGALPSGRSAGEPLASGVTPEAHATTDLLNTLRDVAMLNPRFMNNGMTFDVKVKPDEKADHGQSARDLHTYIKTFFSAGGMQIGLNMISSALLRDALEHPDSYKDLLVRISGANAYFVTLSKDIQKDLIARTEFRL